MYGLSLPERLARVMISTAGGALRGTARVAVPDAFKEGRLYEITVKKMLGFLADDIGRLERAGPGAALAEGRPANPEKDQFVVKKAIGNVIDVAGLAVFHVSPIWVIAIFSDIVHGTRTYLKALVKELKEQGVLPENQTIGNVDHLLEALENTSGTLANSLDTPPVTVDQLRAAVARLRAQASEADLTEVISTEDMARVWNQIEATMLEEHRSLLEVSNAVAMITYTQLVRAGKGAVGTVKVALDLFSDNVVEYYLEAFSRIHHKGYYESVLEVYEHFVDDLRHLFEPSGVTTTEKLLRFGWLRRFWRWLWRRGRSRQRSAISAQPEDASGAISAQRSALSAQPEETSEPVSGQR
jgi:hypothetical protein